MDKSAQRGTMARQASALIEASLLRDPQAAFLLFPKHAVESQRGVPWQLYWQARRKSRCCRGVSWAQRCHPARDPGWHALILVMQVPCTGARPSGQGPGSAHRALVCPACWSPPLHLPSRSRAHPLPPPQVRVVFREMLRRHHVLFSIFLAHEDAQVVLTLPQRVTVGGMGLVPWIGVVCSC